MFADPGISLVVKDQDAGGDQPCGRRSGKSAEEAALDDEKDMEDRFFP